jgi:FixJ family two-component response regulator
MQAIETQALSRAGGAVPPSQFAIVFIVDEDPDARVMLESLVRLAGWHSESFASAEEFLARPRSMSHGCLLLDIQLPQIDGLTLQELIADRRETPVVFVTARRDIRQTVRAMKAGAVDFLTKPCGEAAILQAVRAALDRGRAAMETERMLRALRQKHRSLTTREQQVFGMVVTGLLNKQIGGELGISEITVKAHRGKMMRKMEARSLAELVRLAAHLLPGAAGGPGAKLPRAQ